MAPTALGTRPNQTPVPPVEGGMRRITLLTAIVLVGVLITACSGSGSDTTAAPENGGGGADAEITIADFSFSGAESVSVGDTVEVINNDSVGHTWSAVDESFHSGTLASGDTFEFTFDEAGEFDYFCQIHPNMTGTITVEGGFGISGTIDEVSRAIRLPLVVIAVLA